MDHSRTHNSRSNVKQKKSYGCCLRTPDDHYLLIQNRDSEAFIFLFMARNMPSWEFRFFKRVICACSREEIERLLYYPFEKVYFDLYVNHQPNTFVRQVKQAQRNYQYFHSRKDWFDFALKCTGTPILWGFPKGRIEEGESPQTCALRECQEELSLHKQNHGLYHEIEQSIEQTTESIVFEAYKSFFQFCVLVSLFPIAVSQAYEIEYQNFPNALRPVSVSNEVLHARWVHVSQLDRFLNPVVLNHIQHAVWVNPVPVLPPRAQDTPICKAALADTPLENQHDPDEWTKKDSRETQIRDANTCLT